MNTKDRFDGIQSRAVLLMEDAAVLAQSCNLPQVADDVERRRSAVALHFIRLMRQHAINALWALRKQQQAEMPPIKAGDYDCFSEYVQGIAEAKSEKWSTAANAKLELAESLLAQGEEARRQTDDALLGVEPPTAEFASALIVPEPPTAEASRPAPELGSGPLGLFGC